MHQPISHRTRASIGATALAGLLSLGLLATAGGAAASSGEPTAANPAAVQLNAGPDPELVAAYAERYAVTHDIAVSSIEIESAGQILAPKLEEANADRFVSSRFEHEGGTPQLVIRLTGDTPPEIPAEAAGLKWLQFELGAEHTQAELQAAVAASIDDWQDEFAQLHGAYIDAATDQVVVQTGDTVDAAARRAVASTSTDGVTVQVEHVDAPVGDTNRGGNHLTSCTSAFTVRNSSGGVRGFLTAAHCGTQSYYYNNGTSAFSTTLVAQTYNSTADIQFRQVTAHTVRPVYFQGSGYVEANNNNFANPIVSQSICAYGKTTGRSCGGVVNSVTYAPGYAGACPSGACAANFVAATFPAASAGGDSGGPWFSGTSQNAVHKGNAGGYRIASKISARPASAYPLLP